MAARADVHGFDYVFPRDSIAVRPWENPIPQLPPSPAIEIARTLVPSKEWYLERPFFKMLKNHPELLKLWVTQECCVSTPFTQVMAKVAEKFADPGIRWVLFRVVAGELGDAYGSPKGLIAPVTVGEFLQVAQDKLNRRIAKRAAPVLSGRDRSTAHALLSDNLRAALGVPREWVTPLPETQVYLDSMWTLLSNGCSAIEALAWFGEAQEGAIENEYSALKEAGAEAFAAPGSSAFPDANITEDFGHREMFRRVSSGLIMSNPTAGLRELAGELYVDAARKAHYERGTLYYDALAVTAEEWLRDPELLSALGRSNQHFAETYAAWVDPTGPAVEKAVQDLAAGELGRFLELMGSEPWVAQY